LTGSTGFTGYFLSGFLILFILLILSKNANSYIKKQFDE